MNYYAFNIGKPATDEAWFQLRSRNIIAAGYEGLPGDRGDVILHQIEEGACVLAYANGFGFVGAGVAKGPNSYRRVKDGNLQSGHSHVASVHWQYYVEALLDGVSKDDAQWHAPRQTKERIKDTEVAEGIIERLKARTINPSDRLAEEIELGETYTEGAQVQIFISRYERSPEARRACIAKWGCTCSVCNLNFRAMYGERGEGFIHVHHLTPIATQGGEYEIDPIRDLRPVCPNCHAMLHKGETLLGIEELKEIIRQSGR